LIKDLGNKSFKEKDYEQAMDHYLNAVCIFRYFCPIKKTIIEEASLSFHLKSEIQDVRAFMNTLFLNITACYLAIKEFEKALFSIEESLRIDQANDKAWYRKAKALEGTNLVSDLPDAIECVELAIRYSKNKNDEMYFRKFQQELNEKFFNLQKAELQSIELLESTISGSFTDTRSDHEQFDVKEFTKIRKRISEGIHEHRSFHFLNK
jgi:tetratricopeptide (TPR) repeat protein